MAAYAEELFHTPEVWEYVLSEEPSFKDRVLSFFKGANKKYSFEPGMTKAAKKWLLEYKRLFNEVSAYNKGANAAQNAVASEGVRKIERIGRVVESAEGRGQNAELDVDYDGKNTQKSTLTNMKQEKMHVSDSGERAALKKKEYDNAYVNGDIITLIDKINGRDFKQNEKVYLKNLPVAVSRKITELTGVDVSAFKIAIEARQLEHILKEHGENGRTNMSMRNYVDIAKMEYAMQSPDEISLAGKTQAYSYMKNGYNRTADTVLYEKYIGDESYYVVQAIPDTKSKTLYIVSAFKGQQGYKKEASQLINAKSPDVTPKNGSVVTSDNSIPDSTAKSNSFDKNSSKKLTMGRDMR